MAAPTRAAEMRLESTCPPSPRSRMLLSGRRIKATGRGGVLRENPVFGPNTIKVDQTSRLIVFYHNGMAPHANSTSRTVSG